MAITEIKAYKTASGKIFEKVELAMLEEVNYALIKGCEKINEYLNAIRKAINASKKAN